MPVYSGALSFDNLPGEFKTLHKSTALGAALLPACLSCCDCALGRRSHGNWSGVSVASLRRDALAGVAGYVKSRLAPLRSSETQEPRGHLPPATFRPKSIFGGVLGFAPTPFTDGGHRTLFAYRVGTNAQVKTHAWKPATTLPACSRSAREVARISGARH